MIAQRTEGQPGARLTPIWVLVLAGAASTCAALDARRRTQAAGHTHATAAAQRVLQRGTGLELERACPRELRRVPGIGRRLSLEIVRLRDARGGGPFELTEVRGIGPAIARRVAEWLAEPR